jgi:hypothetical protein
MKRREYLKLASRDERLAGLLVDVVARQTRRLFWLAAGCLILICDLPPLFVWCARWAGGQLVSYIINLRNAECACVEALGSMTVGATRQSRMIGWNIPRPTGQRQLRMTGVVTCCCKWINPWR